MERHLSTGVATLVALMAAHRAAAADRPARAYSQDEVARIEAMLKRWSPLGLRSQEDANAINSHLQQRDRSL